MTNLEQALAMILEAIEHNRATGNAHALVTLLRRKEAICAALAAPEHSWHEPMSPAQAPATQRRAA
jgi:hypothetical protein